MFREELPPDSGMLFAFADMQPRSFWMYQTRIPLDIIWMDDTSRVVHISAGTPPCKAAQGSDCPGYGGDVASQYVLEIAAGQAAAHGLKVGDRLRF